MKDKGYKEYRKEVCKIINNKDTVENIRKNLLDYYSIHNISKENLMKRYNNIVCYEKNFSSHISGILGGLIVSLITSLIGFEYLGVNTLLITLFSFLIGALAYDYFIKYWFANNNEVCINPYEKLLIEEYLKEKYDFEINPTEVKLIKPIKNNPPKIETSKSIEIELPQSIENEQTTEEEKV